VQIDKQTGRVVIGNMEIDPSVTMDAFSRSEYCESIVAVNAAEGWYSAKVHALRDDVGWMFVRLSFRHQRLMAIFFAVSARKELTWDNWSEAGELQAKRLHDDLVESQLGPQRRFPWGSVESYVDPKLMESMVAVEYTGHSANTRP
jgi:hypothetical protein